MRAANQKQEASSCEEAFSIALEKLILLAFDLHAPPVRGHDHFIEDRPWPKGISSIRPSRGSPGQSGLD